MTRTRTTFAALVAVLAIISIACGAALSDGEAGAPATDGSDRAGFGDDLAFLPSSFEALAFEEGGAFSRIAPDALASGSLANTDEAAPFDPQLQSLSDRKIIQSTSVDIKVEEVGRDFQEIIRIAETAGGFVASATFSNIDERQVADITIRVPADRYQSVLAQIRGMGEVTTESSDANDVTEEYTDLQARLRTMEATERRYLELLSQANEISDILLVQDRLDFVRGQIEQVQGRINLLEHLTDLATITIHLRPLAAAATPTDGGGLHPLEAAAGAWENSLAALRGLALAVLVVGAFSWWLAPPLAVLAIASRWWFRRQQSGAIGPSA